MPGKSENVFNLEIIIDLLSGSMLNFGCARWSGGFKHFDFHEVRQAKTRATQPGRNESNLTDISQMGWNHELENMWKPGVTSGICFKGLSIVNMAISNSSLIHFILKCQISWLLEIGGKTCAGDMKEWFLASSAWDNKLLMQFNSRVWSPKYSVIRMQLHDASCMFPGPVYRFPKLVVNH